MKKDRSLFHGVIRWQGTFVDERVLAANVPFEFIYEIISLKSNLFDTEVPLWLALAESSRGMVEIENVYFAQWKDEPGYIYVLGFVETLRRLCNETKLKGKFKRIVKALARLSDRRAQKTYGLSTKRIQNLIRDFNIEIVDKPST